MDNLTHSLTGLFLSHAGLNRFTPKATILLVLSANAPDIDIVALAGGGLNYFHYHRGMTHALAFAPVLALVLVAGFRFLAGVRLPWLPAFAVSLVGVLSHLALDLTNDYGERIFLPFSGQWLAWDICSLYDFWIWAAFAVCIAGPFLSRLVGSEIGGAGRRIYPSRGFPVLAVAFLLIFDGGRAVLHERAVATLETRQYEGEAPTGVAAFPNPTNPLRWEALAVTPGIYRVYDLDLLGNFNPARGRAIQTLAPDVAVQQAEAFRVLTDFARFPIWRKEPSGDEGKPGELVTLRDVRFPFQAAALVSPAGNILSTQFQFR